MSTSKMLIDASHPEETRVVVLKGNRLEEFDFESVSKKQLRGNIYLAKVTRVEPSLQAAFIEYGGNRHGFLAFSEIHPDYYLIPHADKQALMEEEARAHRDEDDDARGSEARSIESQPRNSRTDDRGGESRNGERGGRGDRSRRGERHERGGERNERGGERGERGQRRSRRHRRDGGGSALQRRGPPDDAVSEPALDAEPLSEAIGFDREGHVSGFEAAEIGSEPMGDRATGQDPDLGVAEGWRGSADSTDASPTGRGVEASAELNAADPEVVEVVPSSEIAEDRDEGRDEESLEDLSVDAAVIASTPVVSEPDVPGPVDVVEAARNHVADETHETFVADEAREASPDGEDSANELEADAAQGSERTPDMVEQIGGDALEDVAPRPTRLRRHYKIQEVIKRRQILLIQVNKEERGNKGAALTTYLSLAGRYSVLMPNTARGGGISRKITDGEDRKRLKAIAQELDLPEGMGVILRTAGAARSSTEIRRDVEYLLRMWESVRELTLKSTAPTLVYEEGSLIKRSIRDLYSTEIEDIVVAGEEGFGEARDFMRMLMPNNVKNVQLYRDAQPIFAKSGVEAQLDAMFSNHVTLKSGGYLVINQTEALVAIDVNSGRSTREHNIEDTALRTNLEAADEVARQLRLRDLAGLIVVDFIDMEESRNNRAVERRIKDALKNDRARIQIGHISHFGLMEMSRQRIRTGVLEGSTVVCPHCAGAGTVRSTASIALHVLRLVEDALIRDASHDIVVRSRAEVALYVLNQKRAKLIELEQRFGISITVAADATLTGMVYHAIERGELATAALAPPPRRDLVRVDSIAPVFAPSSEGEDEDGQEVAEGDDEIEGDGASSAPAEAEDNGRRRKRRRRRRGRDREMPGDVAAGGPQSPDDDAAVTAAIDGDVPADASADETSAENAGPADDLIDAVRETSAPEAMADDVLPAAHTDGAPVSTGEALDEPPRRRRSRRTPVRGEKDVADREIEPAAAQDAAPPRRRRKSARPGAAATVVEDAGQVEGTASEPAEPLMSRPSADRDVGADTVEHHAPSVAPDGDEAPESMRDRPHTNVVAEPEEVPEPETASDPDRPKRSGWWQRAKASFGS